MFFRVVDKERLPDLIAGLSSDHEVIGPIEKDGRFVFAPISDPSQIRLDYDTTLLPPKKWLMPPEETMMHFNCADEEVTDDAVVASPRVLFGLHPCDINSLLLLDNVFLQGRVDPYYKARRDNTLIVGMSCTPSPTCFCNVWDTDEVHWGFDIFLTDLGDRYYASLRTVKGAEVLDRHVDSRAVTEQDTADFQQVVREFKQGFSNNVDTAQLPVLLDAKFDSSVWDDFGSECLSCGACSMVCPTCYCFDVKDRLEVDQQSGDRVRTWDSCQFKEFAAVAHGQNFREDRSSRLKYRYYHKYWGYLSKFERVLCVGCGRCTLACPSGISPVKVIEALQTEGSR